MEKNSDEEAFLFAMELSFASSVPMVLKTALELGIIEIIAKSGPNAYLSSSQIASQIPSIKNPDDAPSMLDRLLRLLVSYKILTCSIQHQSGDSNEERLYGLHPLAKYFVKSNNEDAHGASMSSFFLMQHDIVLKDMWYHLTDSIKDGGLPFNNAFGMNVFEFHAINPRFNNLFNKGMSDSSSLIMMKILETYSGFEGLESVVDVGGGIGTVTYMIVSKYPNIKAINFDLPHVINEAPSYPGVEHVGGDIYWKGGKERTQKEFEALARGAGFQGFQIACCAFNMYVMEFLKNA
ncbi:unnamed protein product [Vicia faba]|uniref:Caffeic acid O-methyltransferase n=1 Tax=Vicia faba TaxID=3906 RepID=A0AAV0YSW5_VICFA|nr:unnamed protein product [Vicia faba]